MKAFAILVILAAAAAAWWWWGRAPAPAPESGPFGGVNTAPALGGAAGALPAEAKAALEQADQLWSQAGPEPATSAQAPRIARLYTQALRALYNLPGGWDREEQLVRERLAPLGEALFLSRSRFPEDQEGLMAVHQVQPGENPDAIAKVYGMSLELLNRLRGAKNPTDSNLRAGDALKVVKAKDKGGFLLHIDKGSYYLDCLVGGVFARRYVISHGAKESPTPTGRTRLTNRVWHPSWTHPTTHVTYAYEAPENILGPIWLPFDAAGLGQAGLGIHGYTGADAQMQAQVSNGCIRMQNDQAEELYRTLSHPDRAPTAVEIVE